MNLDYQKFFIGLMDFFYILLSGTPLTWLLMGELVPVVLGDRYAKLAPLLHWPDRATRIKQQVLGTRESEWNKSVSASNEAVMR